MLVQAGSSEDGKEFAAQYAEAIFTAQQTLKGSPTFLFRCKIKIGQVWPHSEQLMILPGICPIIGSTESEAKEKEQELNELTVMNMG